MRESSPIFSTITAARAEGLAEAAIERRVWERHGTTCALLALDSSGMTQYTRAFGIVEFLTRYMEMTVIAERALEHHRCLAWRSFADNLFAEFPTVDAALAAALAIHRQLSASGIRIAGRAPYRVCIGIGYGRVLDDGSGGKMGDEMNVVAKLAEDVAEAGQTILSEAAHQHLSPSMFGSFEKLALRVGKVDVVCHRLQA